MDKDNKKKYYAKPRSKVNAEDYMYGIQPVLEALEADKSIEKILINRESPNEHLREIHRIAQQKNILVSRVPTQKLDRVTTKNHQGVIAFTSAISYALVENVIASVYERGEVPFILMLDRVTDVRNFGAIARTAECAGVHCIVIPAKGSAQIGSDAVRTSAGALNYIPVCKVNSLEKAVRELQDSGLQIVGCSEKGQETIYDVDYTLPTAIVMGSEEDGISDEIIRKADKLCQIPMEGKVSSLNVSVAAGIIVFEGIRQKQL